MSGALAADEQPVLAADGDGAHGTLGEHLSIQTLEANGNWELRFNPKPAYPLETVLPPCSCPRQRLFRIRVQTAHQKFAIQSHFRHHNFM